jgi:hypothetical protein
MIKLEFKFAVRNSSFAMDASRVQINRLNIGIDKLYMTKNAAKRVHDVAWIKIACCDLMQHRRKQDEIFAADERNLYVRPTRQPFVEVHCRVKPGEPATGNDDSRRFHTITANRNPTRAIKILLIPAIIQSFSQSFLKLLNLEISQNLNFSRAWLG